MAARIAGRRSGGGRALIRPLAALSLAVVVLHELRYLSWLGGAHAHAGGHVSGGWLTLAAPVLAIIVAGSFATALAVAARRRTSTPECSARLRNLWLIATGGLLAT